MSNAHAPLYDEIAENDRDQQSQVQFYQGEYRQPQSVIQYAPALPEDIVVAVEAASKQPGPINPFRFSISLTFLVCSIILIFCSLIPCTYIIHTRGESSDNYTGISPFSAWTHFYNMNETNTGNAKYPSNLIQETTYFNQECQVEWSQWGKAEQRLFIQNCKLWKATGAMTIVGGSLGTLGVIATFSSATIVPHSFLIRHLSTVLPLLASISGFITLAIFKYELNHEEGLESNEQTTTSLGAGFWVLMTSSSLFALASLTYGYYGKPRVKEPKEGDLNQQLV